jgi:hypothetical protein
MANDNPMTPEDAYDVLVSQVHAPVFFEKLANVYGIQPANQDEARELLLMAGELRNLHEQNANKQANVRGSFLTEARNELHDIATNLGYKSLVDNTAHVKSAAANAVKNPLIRDAALVFNQYVTNLTAQARS